MSNSSETVTLESTRLLRRAEAAKHVEHRWGVPCSKKSLAKWAVTGVGPAYRKAGKFPLYDIADLDAWAQAKIGPRIHSTSEHRDTHSTKLETVAA